MWNLGTCPDLWYSKGSYSSGLFSYCKLYWYLHDVSSCQRTGSHQTLCFLQHVRCKFLVLLHYNLACHFEFKSFYRSFNFLEKNSGKLIGQKLYTCSPKKNGTGIPGCTCRYWYTYMLHVTCISLAIVCLCTSSS